MHCTTLLCRTAAAAAAVTAAATAVPHRGTAYANAIAQALLATSSRASRATPAVTPPSPPLAHARRGKTTAMTTNAIAPRARVGDAHSLAAFCPGIAQMWLAAASSKLLQPHHVRPDSRKLAWWCCLSCQHQFNKRIDRHVADGGACPRCAAKPAQTHTQRPDTATTTAAMAASAPCRQHRHRAHTRGGAMTTTKPLRRLHARARQGQRASTLCGSGGGGALLLPPPTMHTIVHRCRPDNSLETLAAANANRVKASVADGHYLRVQEQRNLLPMLAKNYTHEAHKVASRELLYVSPKLDGVRCIVAYDRQQQRVLFFSRSGTLFECCDVAIEPALRGVFARDPTLVLDGELYNDSANQAQLRALMRVRERGRGRQTTATARPLLQTLLRVPSSTTSAATSHHPFMSFEQLASAVRTTRERRTPAVAALQARLQYHVFDVLYAAAFAGGCGSGASYAQRYDYLARLLDELHAHNSQVNETAARGSSNGKRVAYDPTVVRLLPSLRCVKADVPAALRDAMLVGYEGVMVRRSGICIDDDTQRTSTAAAACDGYAYGQRSSMLLKYKRMCDDEFVIVDALEGRGKWRGCLGAFVCTTRDRQHTFTVAPASTDDEKRRMWRCWRSAYKGKALTVQYQALTPDGVPRFPVAKCVRGAPHGKDWI